MNDGVPSGTGVYGRRRDGSELPTPDFRKSRKLFSDSDISLECAPVRARSDGGVFQAASDASDRLVTHEPPGVENNLESSTDMVSAERRPEGPASQRRMHHPVKEGAFRRGERSFEGPCGRPNYSWQTIVLQWTVRLARLNGAFAPGCETRTLTTPFSEIPFGGFQRLDDMILAHFYLRRNAPHVQPGRSPLLRVARVVQSGW